MKVYLVGGTVRDMLWGLDPKDKDYVVETDFDGLRDYVSNTLRAQVLIEKPNFLTIRARLANGEVVDFTCCREEANYDGRRPSMTRPTDILTDLSRRDFTINAMAMPVEEITLRPYGDIIDPHDGRYELDKNRIRFVGNPHDRIKEDGLRWLRAIRFAVTKYCVLEPATYEAVYNIDYDPLTEVSVERIREELHKCFVHDTFDTLHMLRDLPSYWLRGGLWLKPTLEQR